MHFYILQLFPFMLFQLTALILLINSHICLTIVFIQHLSFFALDRF
jgi:hypothetical protein